MDLDNLRSKRSSPSLYAEEMLMPGDEAGGSVRKERGDPLSMEAGQAHATQAGRSIFVRRDGA